MKKAVIIDDEPLAIDFLERQILKDGRLKVVNKFSDPKQALSYCLMHPDIIVFLDIEMPELNGILFGKRLKTLHPNVTLIYVTAYSNYALDAFDVYASGYLLKPVISDKLTMLLDNIVSVSKAANQSASHNILEITTLGPLSFKCNNQEITFRTKKAEELFCYLVCKNGKWVTSNKIIKDIWALKYSDDINQALHTTIYYCTLALSLFGFEDIIEYSQDSYRINMQLISWDYLNVIETLDNGAAEFADEEQINEISNSITNCSFCDRFYDWSTVINTTLKAKFQAFYQYQVGNPQLSRNEYNILVSIKNKLSII